MKVVFCVAPWGFDEVYPDSMAGPTTIAGASPPLGILYLSAVLKRDGHQTHFVDGLGKQVEDVLERLVEQQPDIVGFSCTTFAWERTADLCRRLKARMPDVITLVGGPHVTGVVINCLEDGVDYGLSGDAEEGMAMFVERLSSGAPLTDVPGLIYRKDDGSPTFNPTRPFKELDALPFPDYDLVDVRDYPPSIAFYNRLPSMTMMTTRGCPALCTFCDASANFRIRSIDNVMAEIEYLKERFGIRHILFYDEDLPLVKPRLHELCHRLIETNAEITWCCNSRADSVDEETLRLMKRAGCWRILLGMETGSQEVLDRVMKGTTLAELKAKAKLIKSLGIETLGTFIFGFPGETYADGLKTIDFAIECDLDYAIFLKLTPFPGTSLAAGIEKEGTLTGIHVPNLISFVPHSMTEEEMARLSVEAIKRFYMRPGYLLKRGLKMRSWRDLERNLRGFFSFFGLRPAEYMDKIRAAERAAQTSQSSQAQSPASSEAIA